MLPYLAAVLLMAVGLLGLWKDWRSHHPYARWILGICLVLLLVVNLVQIKSSLRINRTNLQQIRDLQKTIEGAQKQNEEMKGTFVELFAKLNDRIVSLQTQVRTEELQRQLRDTSKQLVAAQRALVPGPQARLEFGAYVPPEINELPRQIKVAGRSGVIPFDVTVRNATETAAVDGEFHLRLCKGCKWAIEPEGFVAAPGGLETDRMFPFSVLAGKTRIPKIHVEVVPPFGADGFQLAFRYACRTCANEMSVQHLVVTTN